MAENYRRALTEEEIPSAFKNVYGDRTKKPVSVQMAELGTEVLTPIGTINDIYAELEKENPNYVKIAGLAGLELLGTAAPIIEMAAKSGNRGLIKKTLDAWKKNEAENPSLDPNSVEAIEKQLEEQILFDELIDGKKAAENVEVEFDEDLLYEPFTDTSTEYKSSGDQLTEAEKLEQYGPSDPKLESMAKEGNFEYESDLQEAYDKKLLNKKQYLDNKYTLYRKKLAELEKEPYSIGNSIEKEGFRDFIDIYDFHGEDVILEVIADFPHINDQADYVRNILNPMARAMDMPYTNFFEAIDRLATEIGTTGLGLTERPMARARYTGEKIPKKPFLPTDYRGEIEEFRLPKEQRDAFLKGRNLGFKDVVYHVSKESKGDEFTQFLTPDQKWLMDGNKDFKNFNLSAFHDILGTHVGTPRAAAEISGRNPKNRGGFTMELKARLDKPATADILIDETGIDIRDVKPGSPITELDLDHVISKEIANKYPDRIATKEEKIGVIKSFRRKLAEKGYTHIPYINKVEDPKSISYIMLTDRPADSAAVLRDYRAEFDPDKITSPDLRMAEGGPLMNKQMEMAFMKQGGIRDDGMTKDPVSGNNIPPGSMAKEVRDNIPAMLSEGEYVVPADVLRYYGVNFFENLRGQAKQGLQKMEQNGRIGGTPMTQQDIARNMQQPMAAAQGAMMQSPMRIEQQPAPQAMGNTMQPVQAFNQGTTNAGGSPTPENFTSNYNVATARMNTPMFLGTSSQQANIAAAQQNNPNQGVEVTVFKKHYNMNGESTQIKYIQMPGGTLQPAPGQESELAKYPLTEEEWLAYQKSQKGGGGDDTDTTPTGSDTSWMDGINWADQASVKEWVESPEGLGMSEAARTIAKKGGILGAIPQGIQAQDIAKARGIRDYYESIGDTEMVDYLNGKIDTAVEDGGFLISALDKLGLMTGKNYFNQMKNLTAVEQQNIKFGGMDAEEKEKLDTQLLKDKEDRQTAAGEAAKAAQAFKESDEGQEMIDKSDNPDETEANLNKVIAGLETGAQTGTIQLNKGGLMSSKPKKKRGRPKKSGLAGKK